MARQRKNPNEPRPPAREAPPLYADIVEDPLEVIQPYLAQAGIEATEVMYYLYRVVEGGNKTDAFLFKCRAEDYEAENIGKVYGSGLYRLKVYVKDENNPNGVIRAAPKFAVEMPPGYDPAKANRTEEAASAPALTESRIVELIAQTMRSLLPPQPSRADMFEELRAMAEIMRPQGVAAPVNPLQQVRESLALARELKELEPEPKAEGEPGTMEVVKAAIDTFRDTVNAARNPQVSAQSPVQPNPAALAAPVIETNNANEEDDMNLLFQMKMKLLINAAKKESPVDTYAELVYEEAPEEIVSVIIDGKTADNVPWFAALVEIAPGVKPYEAWFNRLRNKVLEYHSEAEPESTG